jgi:hypothetical protein
MILLRVALGISSLWCVSAVATVRDFQQKLIGSQVQVLTDFGNGSGTIVSSLPMGKDQWVFVLTADHVVHIGGTNGAVKRNLRVVTNSEAGSKTLKLIPGKVYAGGGEKSRRADMALIAVLCPASDTFDFSKVVAQIAPYNADNFGEGKYLTAWGYGWGGTPKVDDKQWLGYYVTKDFGTLRFQNNSIASTKNILPIDGDDNYIYTAIVTTLDRWTQASRTWVNGEGASNEGDSGGGWLTTSSSSDSFTLKTDDNPDGLYNGPAANVKEGKVTIPYYTDTLVAVTSKASSQSFDAFGKYQSFAVPISSDDITWIKNSCGCTIKTPGAVAPLVARRDSRRPEGLALTLLSCGAIAGLLVPLRRRL